MREIDLERASKSDRDRHILRPYDDVAVTMLVRGSDSHLVFGQNVTLSFITMRAGSVFELHSHPAEQLMLVVQGFCDEVIEGKIYRVREGDFDSSRTECYSRSVRARSRLQGHRLLRAAPRRLRTHVSRATP